MIPAVCRLSGDIDYAGDEYAGDEYAFFIFFLFIIE